MKKEDFPVNDMEDEHEVLMKELKNEAKEYLKVKPKRHYGGMMSSTHSEDEKEEVKITLIFSLFIFYLN
jgi:hypothetical protein